MTVSVGNTASANSKTVTLNNNKQAGKNCVVALVNMGRRFNSTVTGVTYGGQAMTLISNSVNISGGLWAGIFYLANAPSGNNSMVAASTSNDNDHSTIGVVLNGVDESDLIGDSDAYQVPSSSAVVTRTIPTRFNSMVLCVAGGTGNNSTPEAGQTEIADLAIVNARVGASSKPTTGRFTTMTHTFDSPVSFANMAVAEFKSNLVLQTKNRVSFFS